MEAAASMRQLPPKLYSCHGHGFSYFELVPKRSMSMQSKYDVSDSAFSMETLSNNASAVETTTTMRSREAPLHKQFSDWFGWLRHLRRKSSHDGQQAQQQLSGNRLRLSSTESSNNSTIDSQHLKSVKSLKKIIKSKLKLRTPLEQPITGLSTGHRKQSLISVRDKSLMQLRQKQFEHVNAQSVRSSNRRLLQVLPTVHQTVQLRKVAKQETTNDKLRKLWHEDINSSTASDKEQLPTSTAYLYLPLIHSAGKSSKTKGNAIDMSYKMSRNACTKTALPAMPSHASSFCLGSAKHKFNKNAGVLMQGSFSKETRRQRSKSHAKPASTQRRASNAAEMMAASSTESIIHSSAKHYHHRPATVQSSNAQRNALREPQSRSYMPHKLNRHLTVQQQMASVRYSTQAPIHTIQLRGLSDNLESSSDVPNAYTQQTATASPVRLMQQPTHNSGRSRHNQPAGRTKHSENDARRRSKYDKV